MEPSFSLYFELFHINKAYYILVIFFLKKDIHSSNSAFVFFLFYPTYFHYPKHSEKHFLQAVFFAHK